jgi:hypothetical protein
MPSRRPVITLTTDFGLLDSYVAEMKAKLLGAAPGVQIIDVTHQIPPQDIRRGSVILERLIRVFEPGTVHLVVIDPGVGSPRRLLLAKVRGQYIVCPDNGLLTWTVRCHPLQSCGEILWRPPQASATFAGRDVMAPFAAKLIRSVAWKKWVRPVADPLLLDIHPAKSLGDAEVIYIDHFGNVVTNVGPGILSRSMEIRIGRHRLPLRQTYADVKVDQPVALIGSSGLLEIAVRNGSAARDLKLKVADHIRIVSKYGSHH